MAYLQASKRQRMDPNMFKPSNLTFTNVTLDNNGCFHVDLEDRRMLLSKTTEMALSELHVDMLDIHNIKRDTRFVKTRQFKGTSSPPTSRKFFKADASKPQFMFAPTYKVNTEFDSKSRMSTMYLPDCKIATLGELCHVLSYILSHKHIEFRVENNKCVLHFTKHCDEELIDFDVDTARMLGLCKSDGTPPLILQKMYDAELKWSMTTDPDDSKKVIRISLLRKKGKGDLSVELPYTASRVVWNYISDVSPQFMLASTQLIRTQFTGTKMTQTLATIPINPLNAKLDYEPNSADWKRVEPSPINRFSIQFHDTRGVGFASLKLSFVLQFRTAQLI